MGKTPVDCLSLEDRDSFYSSLSYIARIGMTYGTELHSVWIPEVPGQKLSRNIAGEMWISFVCGMVLSSNEVWVIITNGSKNLRIIKESVFKEEQQRGSGYTTWFVECRIAPSQSGLEASTAVLRGLVFV
jgi:hypothetical protein